MWYVLWTSTGSEKKAVSLVSDMTDRSFVPTKTINLKVKGDWVSKERALFPGYIFIDTQKIEEVASKLLKNEGFNKILTTDKKYFPLYGNDAIFVEKLYNRGGVFDTSEGYIEGDDIRVSSGPLYGLEGLIRKIDRHKRLAYLEFEMFGQKINTAVGLEIIEKT